MSTAVPEQGAGRRRGPAWLQVVVETVRFLVEVAVVVAIGWWGWATPPSRWLGGLLVVLLPLAVMVVWAIMGAPRRSLYRDSRWVPSLVLWFLTALAALALTDLGHPRAAVVLVVLVVVTDLAIHAGVHTAFRPVPGASAPRGG